MIKLQGIKCDWGNLRNAQIHKTLAGFELEMQKENSEAIIYSMAALGKWADLVYLVAPAKQLES